MKEHNVVRYDIAVVGGGASGHAAAISAARADRSLRIVLLESGSRVGRKLLATGNGRCNLSHAGAAVADYHGRTPGFVRPALERYSVEGVVGFFDSIGILCRTEPDGRMYPNGLQASSVQDALRLEVDRLGIRTETSFDVNAILHKDPILLENTPLYENYPFDVRAADGRMVRAGAAIVATGGPAAPQLGGRDAGYGLLASFGHKIVSPLPVIVQITTEKDPVKSLSGIKFEGVATLLDKGMPVRSEQGEVLFTDYGLSGPPILQLSGHVSRITAADRTAGQATDLEAVLDFMPDWVESALVDALLDRAGRLAGITGMDFLSGFVNKRIGQFVIRRALDGKPGDPIGELSGAQAVNIARQIKGTRIRVTGVRGWRNAQATAGGADTADFNPETMQSNKMPGLFACGEVLDIDGDCGGLNLQWAWASGLLAGQSAARLVKG